MKRLPTLSPTEKQKLNECIAVVVRLLNKPHLSEKNNFVLRQKMRYALVILGEKNPSRVLIGRALVIAADLWPFKIYRLRNLIDGQRAQ